MDKNKTKSNMVIISILITAIFSLSCISSKQTNTINVTANAEGEKTIGWGIKRAENHEQPDVGTENKKILEENDGICLGNKEKPYIYLTFDNGYEAGYTPQILDTLKENEVSAIFFITGHYLNTQENLVRRMLEEGHIVGNQLPPS